MRALIGLLLVSGLVACGGTKKPAEEPAQGASSSSSSDETPKWDSSSESADTARRSKELSASAKEDSSSSSSTSSAPASPPPKQRRSDEYDKEATEVVLKRAARQVKQNCGSATDEDGKQSGPWGKGTMKLVLGHNGHLKEAAIGAPFEGKPTGKCAMQAFSRLTYPPWAGSDMFLDWPVDIDPPSKAGTGASDKKK